MEIQPAYKGLLVDYGVESVWSWSQNLSSYGTPTPQIRERGIACGVEHAAEGRAITSPEFRW